MVDILLAAYNGEAFLKEQLDSILAQDYKDWRLIIKDDCSTDGTPAILKAYAEKYPGKIKAVFSPAPSGSAKNNFVSMFPLGTAEYVLFCDQDDVWLPDKISKTMAKMRFMEEQFGKGAPLLVHTDLCVTDQNLKVLFPSFFRMQKFSLSQNALNRAVVQNLVTGCAMMVNRPLLALAGAPEPEQIIMHDWWLYLTAAAFGHVGVVPEPTLFYRQHGKNALGAKKVGENAKSRQRMRWSLENTYRQAAYFQNVFSGRLSEQNKELLAAYCSIPRKNKLTRLYLLFRYGFWKHSFLRRAGQLYAV